MPEYRCPGCGTRVDLPYIQRGTTVNCAACNTAITHKHHYFDPNPYSHASFATPRKRVKVKRSGTGGRSASAPPATAVATITGGGTPNTTYFNDSSAAGWQNPGQVAIRLAYWKLDPALHQMQGLVINRVEVQNYIGAHGGLDKDNLEDHLEAVADLMELNHKQVDATEGTGEAAAALGVIVYKNNAYRMLWGRHVHAGAGIDQIWGKPNPAGGYSHYLIVEAKGPGQTLTVDAWQPLNVGTQMSKRWILDRLSKMSAAGHNLATKILTRIGVTTYVRWPNYNGGTTSYYDEQAVVRNAASPKLSGIVITAGWTGTGALTYAVSGYTRHY